MKIFKQILTITFGAVLLLSCASSPSLQKYYIDSSENENFLSFDLAPGFITLKDNATEESKEALASLKKLNVLAFVKDDKNEVEYKAELLKVNSIIKDNKYTELMSFKDKGRKVSIKYEGDESTETMDEIIVYASDKEKGFALIRVLGDKMQPEKIMSISKNIGNVDTDGFKDLSGILGNLK